MNFLLFIELSKLQASNSKLSVASKEYDLENRTYLFARECRQLVNKLPKSVSNIEDSKQLVRSSGSVGANYIEANESFSKKDFLYRIKICRKESKESVLWLNLLSDLNSDEYEFQSLIDEAVELKKIFSTIIKNSQ